MAAQQTVYVFAFGHDHNAARKAACEQHFARAQGCLASGAVAVKQQCHLRCKTRKAFYLLRRKGCAQHTNGIVVAELVQGEHVHVPLCQQCAALGNNTAPRLRQPIEVLALFIQGRVGAVDILGFFFVGDNTPAKGDDLV